MFNDALCCLNYGRENKGKLKVIDRSHDASHAKKGAGRKGPQERKEAGPRTCTIATAHPLSRPRPLLSKTQGAPPNPTHGMCVCVCVCVCFRHIKNHPGLTT